MKTEPIEFLFVTPAALFKHDGRVTSEGASARLGSVAPTYALAALGYDARTYSISGDLAQAEAMVAGAKRVVFGEMFRMPGGWDAYRRLLRMVKDPRKQAVFSIADDHFDDPEVLAFYQEVLPGCLAVTAVSEELAQTVRRLTSRPVHVSPEPCEGARGAPHAIVTRKPSRLLDWLARRIRVSADIWRLRLLWFGYPMNLPPLLGLLPGLEALSRQVPLLLHCVTKPTAALDAAMTAERLREDARLRIRFTPWSPMIMDSVLAYTDMVLIPSDYQNPVKRAKSPNRLVAALHGGRLALAHPLPAYAPYAQFAWIGEDLCEGIEWAIRHPREVIERVARGQAYIDERHSAEAVARFWLDVLDLGD